MSNYGDTPETLQTFLRLLPPNSLRHFTFSIRLESQSSKLWSLQTIQTLLQNQRGSLNTLAIGAMIAPGAPGTFDGLSFQEFEVLETLTLSRWDMKENVTPTIASTAILAPKLAQFVWDFTDPTRERWGAFSTFQKDWLLEFAQLAIEGRTKLKTIKIVFTPVTSWDSEEQLVKFWPWNLMDEVATAVEKNIEVVYNDHISREDCESLAASFKRLVYGPVRT